MKRMPASTEFVRDAVVDCAQHVDGGFAERVVGLIRDQEQRIARFLQAQQRRNHPIENLDIVRVERRFHASGRRIEDESVDDAIAIQENRRPVYCEDSHFIS